MIHGRFCPCARCEGFAAGGVVYANQFYSPGFSSMALDSFPIEEPKPKPRTFHWFRQSASWFPDGVQVVNDPSTGEELGKVSVSMIPPDEMHGPATYDDGRRFVVLETVLDLEYVVYDSELKTAIQTVPLSLDDAIVQCKQWNDLKNQCDHDWASISHEVIGDYWFCKKCQTETRDWPVPAFVPDFDIIKKAKTRRFRSIDHVDRSFISFLLLFVVVAVLFTAYTIAEGLF